MATLKATVNKLWHYDEWNQALISYFLDGTSLGTKIYLSVDSDLLESIDDFSQAVIDKVVRGESVNLTCLRGKDQRGFPKGVGFLVLTILAAHQMADQEEISERNYFRRLRGLLGLSGEGRPQGMKTAKEAEEPLWKEWNIWLLRKGFQPSAEIGSGPHKYINYPISQCLLRETDKDRLQRLFTEKQWRSTWDDQTLFTQVRCQKSTLTQHLQTLIEDRRRYEAVAEAIHNVFEQWQAADCPFDTGSINRQRSLNRNLFAGIYRTEDPFGMKLNTISTPNNNAVQK